MSQFSSVVKIMLTLKEKIERIFSRDYHELKFIQANPQSRQRFAGHTLRRVERIAIEELQKARNFPIYSCHNGLIEGEKQDYRWVLNSISDFTNFERGLPFFTFSVVLEAITDELPKPIASMVYAPASQETFIAEHEKGAFMAEDFDSRAAFHRLRMLASKEDTDRIIFADSNSTGYNLGSNLLSLAYSASGRGDGCRIEKANWHEISAGLLLVKEAGGKYSFDKIEPGVISGFKAYC